MSVTKIHKTSKTTLLVGIIISIVVMALFFLGGQTPAQEKIIADLSQPRYTDIMLYWCYILLAITVCVLIAFAIMGFFKQLKESPKKALSGFLVLIGLAAMLIIAYSVGDGTPLNIPGYSGTDNVAGTLKMTDMWLFSCYIMLVLTLLAIFVMPFLKRKK
jgi:predicted Na+-dependent transporter